MLNFKMGVSINILNLSLTPFFTVNGCTKPAARALGKVIHWLPAAARLLTAPRLQILTCLSLLTGTVPETF